MKSCILNMGAKSLFVALSLFTTYSYAAVYPLTPTTDVVGEPQQVMARYEDSFITLAQKFNVGFDELSQANPHLDPWIPGEGAIVTIPSRYILPPRAARKGIIINLAELRLYYFTPDNKQVYTYPIGIGRMDMNWKTPLGPQKITQKLANANWYVPQSIKEEARLEGRTMPDFIPPGPENPMGSYKMRLTSPTYLIHGTNKEAGIGRRVSHGCINMYNVDIEELYKLTALNTPVNIVHHPYKVGMKDGYLWLEAHQVLEDYKDNGDYSLEALRIVTQHATASQPVEIDWTLAQKFYAHNRGMPMPIGQLTSTAG